METPTSTPKSSLHPIIWIAAIAIILFSLVGIAAVTGLLPGSKGSTPETQPPAEVVSLEQPPTQAPLVQEPAPVEPPAPAKPASKPVEKKPAKPAPTKQSSNYSSTPSSEQAPTYSSKPAPPPPCPDCATITSINPVKQEGEGTGLGAIAGGVLGGVIGNQIGGGSGRDVARIAGIAGGAYAGHQVEKSQRSHTVYDIRVRFEEDGSGQTLRENGEPVWQVGDKVRIVNGKLVPR
jgi:outer membrane lipoprotein SlyB